MGAIYLLHIVKSRKLGLQSTKLWPEQVQLIELKMVYHGISSIIGACTTA